MPGRKSLFFLMLFMLWNSAGHAEVLSYLRVLFSGAKELEAVNEGNGYQWLSPVSRKACFRVLPAGKQEEVTCRVLYEGKAYRHSFAQMQKLISWYNVFWRRVSHLGLAAALLAYYTKHRNTLSLRQYIGMLVAAVGTLVISQKKTTEWALAELQSCRSLTTGFSPFDAHGNLSGEASGGIKMLSYMGSGYIPSRGGMRPVSSPMIAKERAYLSKQLRHVAGCKYYWVLCDDQGNPRTEQGNYVAFDRYDNVVRCPVDTNAQDPWKTVEDLKKSKVVKQWQTVAQQQISSKPVITLHRGGDVTGS